MINITIDGPDAESVQAQMRRLLQGDERFAAPMVSGVSSDDEQTTSDKPSAPAPAPSKPPRVPRKPKADTATTTTAIPPAIPPTVFVPTAEAQAAVIAAATQDALDEAPEPKVADAPLTLDDVRNSALPYIAKWGKEAAAKDLVPIVMEAGGVPNIGKLDPADQVLLRKVMTAFADAAKAETRFVPKTA